MAQGRQGRVGLEKIYLKDLSFESPQSPAVFRKSWKPNVELDINSRSRVLEEPLFEVILTVTLRAKDEDGVVLLIVEVQQGGIFRIEDFEKQEIRQVLGTLCPNILFPYVRELIDSSALRGGFPALQIAPVSFDAIYAETLRKQAEAGTGSDENEQGAASELDAGSGRGEPH